MPSMADTSDDLNDIKKKLQTAGASSLEDQSNGSLGTLTPSNQMSDWAQGLEDQLKAVQQEGKTLANHGVSTEEKTLDVAPDLGRDHQD